MTFERSLAVVLLAIALGAGINHVLFTLPERRKRVASEARELELHRILDVYDRARSLNTLHRGGVVARSEAPVLGRLPAGVVPIDARDRRRANPAVGKRVQP